MSCRCGIIGNRPGPSSMVAPCPLAHQWIGSTPFEKKTIPSRRGGVFAFRAAGACPRSGKGFHPGQRQRDPHPSEEVAP